MNEPGRIYCTPGSQACRLAKTKTENAISKTPTKKSTMIESVIIEIQEWIKLNHSSNLKINDIINKCGYNRDYFLRKFKQYVGVTVSSFVRNTRFNCAIKMIITTDKRISDIVNQCGLQSHQQLCRATRNRFNITPLQLREETRIRPEDIYWPLGMMILD